MKPKDWLKVFLVATGAEHGCSPEMDPIRIQKGMFLLAEAAELSEAERYQFYADDWGPCSYQIYGDLDRLVASHDLNRRSDSKKKFYWYSPSAELEGATQQLLERADVQARLPLIEVIRGVLTELEFGQIASGIYSQYPEYSVNTRGADLLPQGTNGAKGMLSRLFSSEELRRRADSLVSLREYEQGKFVGSDEFLSSLNG